jgi:hypothetical protein
MGAILRMAEGQKEALRPRPGFDHDFEGRNVTDTKTRK